MTVRIAGVPARAIAAMNERERQRFAAGNPASEALAKEARRHWFSGVPMHWMLDWGTPFPLFVRSATGARFTDVRSEEHTSELQSLMRISYAASCLKKKTNDIRCQHIATQLTNQHQY